MDDSFEGRRIRLRQFINSLNLKSKAFAIRIGKRPSVLSQLLTGYRNITADFAYEIATHYPDLNPEWIISGKGDMKKVVKEYQIEVKQPLIVNDPSPPDPLAGFKDLIARLEALEKDVEQLKQIVYRN